MSKSLLVVSSLVLTWTLTPAMVFAEGANSQQMPATNTTPQPTTEPVAKPAEPEAKPAETTTKPAEPAEPATAPKAKSLNMSKDAWFGQMNPILPALICKGFMLDDNLKKRFDSLKITYEQCTASIPDIAKKCQDQFFKQIPDTIDNEAAATWGRKLGECIGKEYAQKYLIK